MTFEKVSRFPKKELEGEAGEKSWMSVQDLICRTRSQSVQTGGVRQPEKE